MYANVSVRVRMVVSDGIFAIVLTPTRELAFQINDTFRALGISMNLRTSIIVGGLDMLSQCTQLITRPHILIATPGRLAQHVAQGNSVNADMLQHLKFLVLDEADRLLEECFQPDLHTIIDALPPKEDRQTLLFSATMIRVCTCSTHRTHVRVCNACTHACTVCYDGVCRTTISYRCWV